MPCRSQSIAAHPAIVFRFVSGLTKGGEAYDYISGADIWHHDFCAFHAGKSREPYIDGPNDIANISRFSARKMEINAMCIHFFNKIGGSFDHRSDHFPWDQSLVSTNGTDNNSTL